MSLVVLAVGNESRGDDALGPLLLRRLEEEGLPGVTCIGDFQLQIEHALDLQGHELALFIDAGHATPGPFTFTSVSAAASNTHTSHALLPAAVLDVYRRTIGNEPPPAFVLCVRGESFELGDDLSLAAAAHLESAWQFLLGLLPVPVAAGWQRFESTGQS